MERSRSDHPYLPGLSVGPHQRAFSDYYRLVWDHSACLRCQCSVEAAGDSFCAACLAGRAQISDAFEVYIPQALPLLIDPEAEAALAKVGIDLGPVGTVQHPRSLEIPSVGRMPIRYFVRRAETTNMRSEPAGAHTRRKFQSDRLESPARLDLTYNLWFHARLARETLIRWIDKESDYYIEFHISNDSGEIVWCNEEPLSSHSNKGERKPGLRLRRWPALDHLTDADFEQMLRLDPTQSLRLDGVEFNFMNGAVIFAPGRNGLKWEPGHLSETALLTEPPGTVDYQIDFLGIRPTGSIGD